jgi:hypothetical protein
MQWTEQRHDAEREDRAGDSPFRPPGAELGLHWRVAGLLDAHLVRISELATRQRIVDRGRPDRLVIESSHEILKTYPVPGVERRSVLLGEPLR